MEIHINSLFVYTFNFPIDFDFENWKLFKKYINRQNIIVTWHELPKSVSLQADLLSIEFRVILIIQRKQNVSANRFFCLTLILGMLCAHTMNEFSLTILASVWVMALYTFFFHLMAKYFVFVRGHSYHFCQLDEQRILNKERNTLTARIV